MFESTGRGLIVSVVVVAVHHWWGVDGHLGLTGQRHL